MKITFRDIVWVGVITLIIIALSRCHRDEATELEKDVSALVIERRMSDSAHALEARELENQLKINVAKADMARIEQQAAKHKLELSLANVGRLSNELRRIKGMPIDATVITVPGEYVDYCDSLAHTADSLLGTYLVFKRKNNLLLVTKDTAFAIQSRLLSNERIALLSYKKDFEALQHFYKQAEQRSKPVNQVFIGAELIGSQQLLMQNVGAVLSLKTKTNKLWQVSGGLQNGGGWYGRINGNILIRLRK